MHIGNIEIFRNAISCSILFSFHYTGAVISSLIACNSSGEIQATFRISWSLRDFSLKRFVISSFLALF